MHPLKKLSFLMLAFMTCEAQAGSKQDQLKKLQFQMQAIQQAPAAPGTPVKRKPASYIPTSTATVGETVVKSNFVFGSCQSPEGINLQKGHPEYENCMSNDYRFQNPRQLNQRSIGPAIKFDL